MARERVYRAEGVVLKRQDLGETDRLTDIYTKGLGKVRLVAKGVKKPGSRKAGHLEPFSRVALMIARGRELDIITQAEAIETYPSLRADLIMLGHASYLIELLDRFTVEEGEGNLRVYDLLVTSLDRLASSAARPSAVVLYFELRLLDLLGYRPELFHCVGCGTEIKPQDQYFSAHQGGVVCPRCAPSHHDTQKLSLATLKVLRHFQRSNFETAVSPRVGTAIEAQVEEVMQAYLTYILERRLNVPGFIKRVREMSPPDEGYKIAD